MKPYLDAVKDIRKNLLPTDAQLFWHKSSTKRRLEKLLNDLEILLKEEQEIGEQGQQLLQNIHELLLREYKDFNKLGQPKDLDPKNLDKYLIEIADLFTERYKHVMSNRFMRRLYKKLGCELVYGKRVDVIGNEKIKGPAIIAMTHHLAPEESFILQAIIPQHIYEVADLRITLPKLFNLRLHHLKPIRSFANGMGMIEVNRNTPVKGLRDAVTKSIHILEYGQLIGITPAGWTDIDEGQYNIGHSFMVYIAQQAEKVLGKKIPIIPIGIKLENKQSFLRRYILRRYIVRIGKKRYIPNEKFDRNEYAMRLWNYIEKLSA